MKNSNLLYSFPIIQNTLYPVIKIPHLDKPHPNYCCTWDRITEFELLTALFTTMHESLVV